ncbi:hypothetical protein O0L34_g9452 [Tuta absoluta]|nr:hypothetical protein O0L34_g9452 [Tuta absoluta]
MKSLIVFTLASIACYCLVSVEAGVLGDVQLPDDIDPENELDIPKNDSVIAETKNEAPRSLDDETKEVPDIPAPVMEYETVYQDFEMKNGKVLKNKVGGEKTVVNKDGKTETTKFGDPQ